MKKRIKHCTCPKCRRAQYYQCGRPDCPDKKIPKHAKPQIVTEDGNGLICAYCGFVASFDYWEDREICLNTYEATQ